MGTKLQRFDWKKYSTLAGLVAVGLIAMSIFITQMIRRPRSDKVSQFEMPREINPFTVLGLLEHIESRGKLKDSHRAELVNSIREVQQHYFAPQNGQHSIKLEEIARTWVNRAT